MAEPFSVARGQWKLIKIHSVHAASNRRSCQTLAVRKQPNHTGGFDASWTC